MYGFGLPYSVQYTNPQKLVNANLGQGFGDIAVEWKEKYNPKDGAPKSNKNAVGNKGGAPLKNQNARKDGWYSKYYLTQYKSIIAEAEEAAASPLEILWAEIITLWAKIIYSQKTMFVKDKNDKIKELKKVKVEKLKTQIKNPDIEHRKEINNKKLQLQREQFEHQKNMDSIKDW